MQALLDNFKGLIEGEDSGGIFRVIEQTDRLPDHLARAVFEAGRRRAPPGQRGGLEAAIADTRRTVVNVHQVYDQLAAQVYQRSSSRGLLASANIAGSGNLFAHPLAPPDRDDASDAYHWMSVGALARAGPNALQGSLNQVSPPAPEGEEIVKDGCLVPDERTRMSNDATRAWDTRSDDLRARDAKARELTELTKKIESLKQSSAGSTARTARPAPRGKR